MVDRVPERTESAAVPSAHFRLVALAIALIVAIAYANSFPGAFLFDDGDAIVKNTSIRTLRDLRSVFSPPTGAGIGGRPIANLTFALNYAIDGYRPVGYHIVNLAVHIAAAILLFALVRRTLLRPIMRERFGRAATVLGAAVALLWALNPLQTNIADYASQRTEGLMAVFCLLVLYAFVRSEDESSRGWTVVAVAACALGMATKEDMVTAPVLVLLYDRTFVAGTFANALRRRRWTYVGLSSSWLLLAGLMATSRLSARGVGFGLGQSGYRYALTECRTVARYLGLSVWPNPLIFDYGPKYVRHFVSVLPSAALLASAIGATIYALRRAPAIGFAGAWFFVALAPSSSVVPVVHQPCAENRVYLPLAGIAAGVVLVAYRALGRRALGVFGGIALALGIATHARNPAFQSELAIWLDTVAKNPTNERAANNTANALLGRNLNAEAMPYLDAALRLSPGYGDAHNNRGVVFLREHQPAKAVPEFRAAVRDKDNFADAEYNLGEAYLEIDRSADAIGPLRAAIQLEPNSAKAHNNLGMALLNVGRVEESIAEDRRAVELDPRMAQAHYNLGNSLAKAGKLEPAVTEFEAALHIDPHFAKAQNNAGVALLRMGRREEARKRFEAALHLNPDYPAARSNLALVR